MNVLVLEDDAPFARLMAAMLAQDEEPHVVAQASSLAEGLACLRAQAFDAVFVDLGLPDSKSLPTFRAVRDVAGDAPVVVVSGTDDEAIALEAVREGAADYLVKGGLTYRAVRRVLRHSVERKLLLLERDRLIRQLQTALAEVKTLYGILPICAECRRVRDHTGAWQQIELYVRAHSNADFSHGLCPTCATKWLDPAHRLR